MDKKLVGEKVIDFLLYLRKNDLDPTRVALQADEESICFVWDKAGELNNYVDVEIFDTETLMAVSNDKIPPYVYNTNNDWDFIKHYLLLWKKAKEIE